MKLRELKALADGSKTPNLDELSAIYTAGETTEDITTKAYLFGILLKAANSNNKKIAAAAKECIVHVQEVELEV